ncbi:MAG: hypothetical protein GF418_03865 [Chitinivibrionales bacterium]|nr:hypothetical protein [Chitinivibrionales bacterium]MBD3394742.1 hypothetical protein [Chitinivibrionales bacterium]
MMHPTRLTFPAVMAALLTACGGAQGFSNIAATFPFGLPLNASSGAAINMGGAAAGVLNDHNVLLDNPANLGAITKTAFSGLLVLDGMRITQGGRHSNHVAVSPRQISFAFPLGLAGVVALSIQKETDATVRFFTDSVRLSTSGFFGRLGYHKSGGLTAWRAGWGRSIAGKAYVGAAYERLYLDIRSTKVIDLNNYPANSTRDSTQVGFRGHGLHLGLMVPIAKATIGVAGRYVFKNDVESIQGQFRLNEESALPGSRMKQKSTLRIPPQGVLGVSYDFSPRWLAAMDLGVVGWREYSSHGILADADRDYAVSYGIGGRFIPAPRLLAPKYWETMHYRLGFRYAQLPRESAREVSLAAGVGFPVKGGGLLDLVVNLGRRTDDAYDDYREDFVQINFGINGGRKWIRSSPTSY